MDIRLEYRIDLLPRFCLYYKSAFRSGHGGTVGRLRQGLYRLAYYAMDALGIGASAISATVTARGQAKAVHLDGRNRQFNVLYFAKYALAYEPEVALTLRDFYRDDMVFLDVGSNWGYFSV
jgi:hypothetical protein